VRYTLKRRVFGGPDFIEISQDEFNRWKCTQSKLLDVLNIEATFDLFLENYAEFERDFLAINHRLALFQAHGEPLGHYREMNRRMMNLLSSARLYLDEVPQDLHAIYPQNPAPAATFKQRCSAHYDSSLAYRVMEALRNYAQHSGFPIHVVTHGLQHEEKNPGFLHRMTLHLHVHVQRLDHSNFKKAVLHELKPRADRHGCVELTPFIPEYIEKLCEVHESLRGLISTDVASWDQTIMSVLDNARQAFGENLSGLAVVAEEEDEEADYWDVESADIFREPIDWRKQLEEKNKDFSNLAARYVVGSAHHP
jgi:hypothetical protein